MRLRVRIAQRSLARDCGSLCWTHLTAHRRRARRPGGRQQGQVEDHRHDRDRVLEEASGFQPVPIPAMFNLCGHHGSVSSTAQMRPSQDFRELLLRTQVSQVPHEEVSEEAQRAGLAAGHCLQQRPRVRFSIAIICRMRNSLCTVHRDHKIRTASAPSCRRLPGYTAGLDATSVPCQLMCGDPVLRRVYELRYFNIAENEGEDEE